MVPWCRHQLLPAEHDLAAVSSHWSHVSIHPLTTGVPIRPPGYVHKMIAQSWQPNALAFSGANNTAFSAQSSDDGKSVVLRFVNSASQQESATVTLQQDGAALDVSTVAQMVTMSSSDPGAANPPGVFAHVPALMRRDTCVMVMSASLSCVQFLISDALVVLCHGRRSHASESQELQPAKFQVGVHDHPGA